MTEPGPDDPSHALETCTEDELLDAVRAGDTGAYAELYRRHRHEALRLARSLGTLHDPDDVAQEAFLKVLKAILRGAGPRRGFAPYLLRTVRNEVIDRARRTHEDAVEDLEHAAPDSFVSPDGVDELFDRQLVRTAFEGLPETWRRILWLTEVEGETPRALAPQLGRSPNAISQLSRRAREGLRAAWLQAHLDVAGAAPTCRSVAKDLDAHENGRLAPARSAAVASHLETCTRCAAARDELRGLAVQLRAVLLPLVLGSPLLLERLSADVAAVGPAAGETPADGSAAHGAGADDASTAPAPTASLDPLVGAGLVRGSLIAHAGAVATLGALAVLAVGGTLMLGAAQESTSTAGAAGAAHAGADGADEAQEGGDAGGEAGTGQGADGAAGSEGADPATATSDPDGIDGAESSTVSVDGSAGDDVTLSPVQLPVVAPGPDDASPAPPGTATPTPPQEPTSPAVPGPGPASADEDPAGPSAPVQDPTTGTPQEPPAQTEDDPSDPASEPAHAPSPPKQGPTQQPPLPGMPGGSPSDPPASVPTSVDPSPGDGQSSGGGSGDDSTGDSAGGSTDDSAGAPVVVEPGYAPGPQLPPAVEAPSDPPDEETVAF